MCDKCCWTAQNTSLPGAQGKQNHAATYSMVRRHEIVEENRLIVGTNHAPFSSRPGRPKRVGHGSTEGPRPSASGIGGGRLLGSGVSPCRQRRQPASTLGDALRAILSREEAASVASVAGPGPQRYRGAAVLRGALVSSERPLRQLCLRVPRLPSNPPVERTADAAAHRQQRYPDALRTSTRHWQG